MKMFSIGISPKVLRQYLRLVHREKLSATEAQQLFFFKLDRLNWKNYFTAFESHQFQFKIVTDYSSLINISTTLKTCSAFRHDLKQGFLQGNHLRYEILNNNKLVGTVVIRPSRSGGFSFYGLSFQHGYINPERNPVLDKDLHHAYQEFYKETIAANPVFFNIPLTSVTIDDSCL